MIPVPIWDVILVDTAEPRGRRLYVVEARHRAAAISAARREAAADQRDAQAALAHISEA